MISPLYSNRQQHWIWKIRSSADSTGLSTTGGNFQEDKDELKKKESIEIITNCLTEIVYPLSVSVYATQNLYAYTLRYVKRN